MEGPRGRSPEGAGCACEYMFSHSFISSAILLLGVRGLGSAGNSQGSMGKAGFLVGLNPLWGQAELVVETVGMGAGWQQAYGGQWWLGSVCVCVGGVI